MSTKPGHLHRDSGPEEQTSGLLTDSEVEERADMEEDRRRERELDDGEMGGEA